MSNTFRLSIPGMKCAGCTSAIEKALDEQIGVISSQVDMETKTAVVECDITIGVLHETIKSAGFEGTGMSAEQGGSWP